MQRSCEKDKADYLWRDCGHLGCKCYLSPRTWIPAQTDSRVDRILIHPGAVVQPWGLEPQTWPTRSARSNQLSSP